MKQLFNQLSDKLLTSLTEAEHLKMSINGENSQFIRFSQSKIRQSGFVDDASLSISLIKDGRILD
jgi:predicted Zn-dependent protease